MADLSHVVDDVIDANRSRLLLPQSGIPVNDPRVDRIIDANRLRLLIPAEGVRTDR
jgi:hypothetical protein